MRGNRPVKRWSCCLTALLLTAAALQTLSAQQVVEPGGIVQDLKADPVRPLFYASLFGGDIAVIDIPSASVLMPKIALAGYPGEMTVEPDGSKLYVALLDSHDVAVIDLAARTVERLIDLSAMETGPTGLALGRPGRLYAISNDGVSVVDTGMGAEVSFTNPPGTSISKSYLAISSDANTLYAMNQGTSPATIDIFDVSSDVPAFKGRDCCQDSFGGSGNDIVVSSDGSKIFVGSGSPYYFNVLTTIPLLYVKNAIPAGAYPDAIALSPDETKVYLAVNGELFTADTRNFLPFRQDLLGGADAIGHGMVLSKDGKTLGAAVEYSSSDPDRVSLVDLNDSTPNRGGIKLRPLDDLTGEPIHGALIFTEAAARYSAYIDVAAGVLGYAPLEPGVVTIELKSSAHETITRTVTIRAGRWTDLGDTVMTRTGTMEDPDNVCVVPAVASGQTRDVEIHGLGFLPGSGLTVAILDPDITLNSFRFRSWCVIDANITVAAGADPGFRRGVIEVTNPDGQRERGNIMIGDGAASQLRPPNRIPQLLAVKTLPSDVRLLWDDAPLDLMHDGAARYLVFRSVLAPYAGFAQIYEVVNSPSYREQTLDVGAIGQASPLSALHFYLVSAANGAGDSGDLP